MGQNAAFWTKDQSNKFVLSYLRENESIIAEAIRLDRFEGDILRMNDMESNLSIEDRFDLHFDMILGESKITAKDYYYRLTSGVDLILEEAKKVNFGPALHRIERAAYDFKNAINEQAVISAQDMAQLKSLAGSQEGSMGSMKILGSLKDLVEAITEGGSTIGVIHLLLDVIGFLGDGFVPGIGVLADLLNASIYYYRAQQKGGEGFYTMCIISVIAAVLPGLGDTAKIFKPVAKLGDSVIGAMIKGSKEGAEAISKVPSHQKPMLLKFLRFLAKNGANAFAKAAEIFAKTSSAVIAKLAGWVPFIGKPLSSFFKKIGAGAANAAAGARKFAANFAEVEKTATKAKTAGNAATKTASAAKATAEVSKPGAKKFVSGLLTKLNKYTKLSTRSLIFIGRQIVKLASNKTEIGEKIDDEQAELIGATALHDWLEDETKKRKEESGAAYIPEMIIDSADKKAFDHMVNYQNSIAKLYDQPKIIPVIYERYKDQNEEEAEEFKDLYKKAKEGELTEMSESVQRFIVGFDKFNTSSR